MTAAAQTQAPRGTPILTFHVPLLPPSVNHYKVRRFYNSPAAKAFIDAVCIFSRKQPVLGAFYQVQVYYIMAPEEFLKWDVDNFSKVTLDALKVAGVIRDDRYVVELNLTKQKAAEPVAGATVYCVIGRAE
jgi:Holliday junction resolvase RusA-like endonuclease